MRVFFAHPKSFPEDVIERWQHVLTESLNGSPLAQGEPVEVVTGRDDFNENVASAGGFQKWAEDVAARIDSITRRKVYDMIFVTPSHFGSATATICSGAFEQGTPVFVVTCDDIMGEGGALNVSRAVAVEVVDKRDFRSGYTLR